MRRFWEGGKAGTEAGVSTPSRRERRLQDEVTELTTALGNNRCVGADCRGGLVGLDGEPSGRSQVAQGRSDSVDADAGAQRVRSQALPDHTGGDRHIRPNRLFEDGKVAAAGGPAPRLRRCRCCHLLQDGHRAGPAATGKLQSGLNIRVG